MAHIFNARSNYRPNRATQLACAAEVAYEKPNTIESIARSHWHASEFYYFDVHATQCFVAANYDEIIVCFRGSESKLEDWIVDLDCTLVRNPMGGKVHEGFYDGLAYVWAALDECVRQLLRDRPRKLWLAGHSLGGALAALAASEWAANSLLATGVYTFGQPRVGDSQFARAFDLALRHRTFRVVNHLDIVTRTPPRSMGYSHSSTLIYLTDDGEMEHDMGWWQRFLNGWKGGIDSIFEWCGEGVEDHRMAAYRTQLEVHAPPPLVEAPATIPMPTVRPRRRAA